MSLMVEYKQVEILRNEHVALKDVNLKIGRGEFVYLYGRVGSGKTSLMKSMYAEVPIASGQARIFEYDLCDIRAKEIPFLRRKIGIVFQDFQLLSDRTAYSNLEFVLEATGWADKKERAERIEKVLRQVGMLTKAYKMPHQLSGGEQQRVAIARALLNEPSLILADEPTGNLDPETGEQVMELLYSISSNNGATIVVATHNPSFKRLFPGRTLRCEDKKLIE